MKRHPHLQPLSRQHHNGLLMGLLLKKGVAKGASVADMNAFIASNWDEELRLHFEMEESLLLPALKNTSFNAAWIEQLLEDHQKIRSGVEAAREGHSGIPAITEFYLLLEKHIRFEEKTFFPEAEKILSEEQLISIGAQLEEDRSRNCLHYPVKFWE